MKKSFAKFYRDGNKEYSIGGTPLYDYNDNLDEYDTRSNARYYPCENLDDPYYMDKVDVKDFHDEFNNTLKGEIKKAVGSYTKKVILEEFLAYIHDSIMDNTDLFNVICKYTHLPKDDLSKEVVYKWLSNTLTKYYKHYPDKLYNAVLDDEMYDALIQEVYDNMYDTHPAIDYLIDIILRLYKGGNNNPTCVEVGDVVKFFEYPNTFVKPTEIEKYIDDVISRENWDDIFVDIILDPESYNVHAPTLDELEYDKIYRYADEVIKQDARIRR